MNSSRLPLTSTAALLAYLAINVVAGALHHHEPEEHASGWMTAYLANSEIPAPDPAPDDHDDDDDDETCVVCSVLHLAQKPPVIFSLEVTSVSSGEAASAAPVSRSYPLQSATRSRAPPLA